MRLQRENETIEEAKTLLIKACQKNEFQNKILVIKHKKSQNELFSTKNDNGLIEIDISE